MKVYPDQSKWDGLSAFVNSSFPDLPPSIGVATLDAIDATGEVYAINDRVTPSDTLTSLPINLLPYKDTDAQVLLSFFYQAGGKGEVPEPKDSLVLEYYSPGLDEWVWAWKASQIRPGPSARKFLTFPGVFTRMVSGFVSGIIPACPSMRSRGSMEPSATWISGILIISCWTRCPGPVMNPSMILPLWIRLQDLLYDYTTVPWNHVEYAQSIGRNMVRFVVRNFHPIDTANIERSYRVTNVLTQETSNYEILAGEIGPNPDSVWIRNDPFNHSFYYEPTAYGQFEVTAFITTPASQFLGNDTVKYTQLFRDTYGYDDGTAEYGFGISGESTTGAMIACRFPIFREDTIRGIDIFFNKTRNNYTADLYFKVCIWKNKNGKPGDTLYVSQDEFTPDTSAGLLELCKIQASLIAGNHCSGYRLCWDPAIAGRLSEHRL